jgi:hypothetical protein
LPKAIIRAGKDGDDAKAYLEKQVNESIKQLKAMEEDQGYVVLIPEFEDVMQLFTHEFFNPHRDFW